MADGLSVARWVGVAGWVCEARWVDVGQGIQEDGVEDGEGDEGDEGAEEPGGYGEEEKGVAEAWHGDCADGCWRWWVAGYS